MIALALVAIMVLALDIVIVSVTSTLTERFFLLFGKQIAYTYFYIKSKII